MEKEPLVLIPGMLCDERLWTHQIGSLEGRAKPLVSMPTGADDIHKLALDVLSRAPIHFALAGFSLGGYIALEIMRIAAHRVSRLALIDTTALPDSPERTEMRKKLIARSQRGEFDAVFRDALLPRLIHPDRQSDDVVVRILEDMAQRLGPDIFIKQSTAVMNRRDYRETLPGIDCPTVIICGRQDAICPVEDHQAMSDAIAGAQLDVIENCGHLSPLERPEAVSAAMQRWLQI